MRLLPSEQKAVIERCTLEFEATGSLVIQEPCDCGRRIQHNNGGKYHKIIFLKRDSDQVFVKYESTKEFKAPAEWEVCEDWKSVIEENSDWLCPDQREPYDVIQDVEAE